MKKHVGVLGGMFVLSGLALGQITARDSQGERVEFTLRQDRAVQQAAQDSDIRPRSLEDEKHLSKKEKKELKKARDREQKDEEHRLKKEAEERKKEDKEREKQLAREQKRDRDKEDKKIAKERHEERKHEEKREEKAKADENHDAREDASGRSMIGRTMSGTMSVAKAPFRVAKFATPKLLRAQRDVGHAIYSQLPTSNVAVLLSDAGQIVLRGAAPSPSLHSRLLQLAMSAAGGYPIVDELVANFAGDAASAAANAAVGGVSDVIHGRPNDKGSDQPPATADSNPPPAYGSATASTVAALDPGSSACVNVSENQVLLTGQTTSQASADLIRQFARQLGPVGATLNDQLATRSTGATATSAASASAGADAAASSISSAAAVTPGSNVCVNVNNSSEVLLTGTVGSASELSAVERGAQPLVASARLMDQLTIGAVNDGSPAAANGGTSGIATAAGIEPASSQMATNAAIASNSAMPAAESELEQALHSIPRLYNVDVQMTADAIRLTGAVDTSQDEQMARDIARQHAPGRSVVDNIAVAGRAPAPPQ